MAALHSRVAAVAIAYTLWVKWGYPPAARRLPADSLDRPRLVRVREPLVGDTSSIPGCSSWSRPAALAANSRTARD